MREPSFWQPGASTVEGAPNVAANVPQPAGDHVVAALARAGRGQLHHARRGPLHHGRARSVAVGRRHVPVLGRAAAPDGRPLRRRHLCRRAFAAGAFLPPASAERRAAPPDDGRDAGDLRRPTPSDHHNFERWNQYWRSGDAAKTQHAVNELLLRLERVRFEPYRLVPKDEAAEDRQPRSTSNRRAMSGACATSSPRTSATTSIACDIAAAADIHPKYAMSVFRKIDRHDAQRIRQPAATELCAGAADEGRRQRHQRRHGQRASARSAPSTNPSASWPACRRPIFARWRPRGRRRKNSELASLRAAGATLPSFADPKPRWVPPGAQERGAPTRSNPRISN